MSDERRVWYLLVDACGEPYKDATHASLIVYSWCLIEHFRDLNRAAFDKRNDENDNLEPMERDASMEGFGMSEEEALIVVVPFGNLREDAMNVKITPKQAVADLEQMIIEDESIFSAQDLLKTINSDKCILDLKIQGLNGVPDLLYSEEMYDDEKEVGIEMPIDRLQKIRNSVTLLIGVSGCGKTRACFDLCRKYWGLYFDCTKDIDFLKLIKKLNSNVSRTKSETGQMQFERLSDRLIDCLIAARLLVLRTMRKLTPDLQCFQWLCIQKSRQSQKLFSEIFDRLSRLPRSVQHRIYTDLQIWFPYEGRIIFDESQHLLEILKFDYDSIMSPRANMITNGRFDHPRSFYLYLSRLMFMRGFRSVWSGTQMRIRCMELSSSYSAGEECYVFTDFNYLEPYHIFNLLPKWLNVDAREYLGVFEEISNLLQGRPKFLTSFLQKLIVSSDINECFRNYVRDMTTNYDSSLSKSSLYFSWQMQLDWTIDPIERTDTRVLETRFVSDTLVQLFISNLFGNGCSFNFSPNYDMTGTNLVMVSKKCGNWNAAMAELLVLSAGLNYMADQTPQVLMNFFANRLFSPLNPPYLTPQEREHVMECVIALRFMQAWWLEAKMQNYLPDWAKALNIQKPLGVCNCRPKDSDVDLFVQQLRNANFPWLIIPSVNAGPDLRYSIFCCYIKTASKPNSQSKIYVQVDECRNNIENMNPRNWYKSQPFMQNDCISEIKNGQRFIHIRFELPDTAPSMKTSFSHGNKDNDYIICVNLESCFARDFFGVAFVNQYREYVSRVTRSKATKIQ